MKKFSDYDFKNMTCEEWRDFWRKFRRCGFVLARQLFPDRPKGYIKAARLLASYANNKAMAMGFRKEGRNKQAEMYERACEDIYSKNEYYVLPLYARW